MKIAQVDLFEIEIPPIPPIAQYSPKIFDLPICRVHTDEGLVGLGEAAHGNSSAFAAQAAAYTGQDPLALDPFAQPDPYPVRAAGYRRPGRRAAALPLFWRESARPGAGFVLVPTDGTARDRG